MPLKNGKHPLEEITCADPDEPKYNGGICAYFNWNNGKPTIYSFAHGGRLYKFNIKPEVKKNAMNNVVDLKEKRQALHNNSEQNVSILHDIDIDGESYLYDVVKPAILNS